MSLQEVQEYARQQRRDGLLSSFKAFARDSGMLPNYAPGTHDEMCDEMAQMEPALGIGRKQKKKLYLAPRGTFKTSIVIAFIVYLVLKHRGIRIVIARAKHEEAKGILYEVKGAFKSPLIMDLFGDLEEKAGIWSEEAINLGTRKEPTVGTSGLDMSQTGMHPDIVFVDDIVNDKNYRSPAILKQAWDVITSFYPVLEPWGCLLVTGTRWSANDVYGVILKEIAEDLEVGIEPSWTSYIRGAWRDDGSLFFPERLSELQLEKHKRDLRSDSRKYAAWYLNQAYDDDTKLFKQEYLRWFTADFYATPFPVIDVLDEETGTRFQIPVEVSMTIDPAQTTNRRSDSTAVTVVGCDADGDWWVLIAK